jgi:predicted ABC-type ATPase
MWQKHTDFSSAREEFQQAPVLDPDAFAKSIRDTLPDGGSDIEAGKRVLLRAEELIDKRQSFTVETTLSGSTYLRMAARAKEAGFLVAIIFVGTSSVEITCNASKPAFLKAGTTSRKKTSVAVIPARSPT